MQRAVGLREYSHSRILQRRQQKHLRGVPSLMIRRQALYKSENRLVFRLRQNKRAGL
jgi:hypothetical protein